jgi:catechol 2,3-dioxygenase-like lactoylglutathione lyase family enzyme
MAGLAVTDIPAAHDFYTQTLGFKLAFMWGDPPVFAGVNLDKAQMFYRRECRIRRDARCTFSSAMRISSSNFIVPTA